MSNNQAKSKRIAVLISGGGTTLKNLTRCQSDGTLAAEIAGVISSNPNAKGLEFAAAAGIPSHTVNWKEYKSARAASREVFRVIDSLGVDLVVAGGFLKRLTIPDEYENRVINIHPSLIPAFCGQGFYGLHVHRAVLEFGCKISGCTVHFVDNEFDHGPIIAQETVSVFGRETPEELAARVFELECSLYPRTINRLLHETWAIRGRKVEFDNEIGRSANEN
ncbi:MAG: phosphoribosylglycinamide formyltransferase [Pirellulaceae bacterium]